MSNGIHIDVVRESDTEIKFVLTMFLNNESKTWVEFDKEQLEGLIDMLIEKRDKHNVEIKNES
jgi:hypothetical protein